MHQTPILVVEKLSEDMPKKPAEQKNKRHHLKNMIVHSKSHAPKIGPEHPTSQNKPIDKVS